jgi:hypothetical protein
MDEIAMRKFGHAPKFLPYVYRWSRIAERSLWLEGLYHQRNPFRRVVLHDAEILIRFFKITVRIAVSKNLNFYLASTINRFQNWQSYPWARVWF